MIGKPLKDARVEAGITQEDLAAKAKLSRNYVSLIELDRKSPTIRVLFRLCEVLHVRPSVIVAKAEKPSK